MGKRIEDPSSFKKSKNPCPRCGSHVRYKSNGHCVDCDRKNGAARHRERSKDDPFYHRKKRHKKSLNGKDPNEILQSQNFKCAICKNDLELDKNKTVLDHCHVQNIVRGFLCYHCNVGLGHFRDSIQNLENAILYLQNYKDKK